jgi:hypothetical protein
MKEVTTESKQSIILIRHGSPSREHTLLTYSYRVYIRLPPRPAGAVSRPRAIVYLGTGLGFGAVRVSFLEAAAALVRPARGAAVCLPLYVDRFHPKQPGCRVVIPSATRSSAAAKQRPGAARSARITITITTSWLGLDGMGTRAYDSLA